MGNFVAGKQNIGVLQQLAVWQNTKLVLDYTDLLTNILADHVSQSVILFVYRKYSRICHFGVQFLDDSATAPKQTRKLVTGG